VRGKVGGGNNNNEEKNNEFDEVGFKTQSK
jgi:hypothetical protein